MAVTSARNIVDLKEKGHFERENARIDKYTLADELPAQLSELSLRPRTMTQPSYSLCRITPDDKDLVLKFLRRFFFRDEPMNLAVNLLETPESRCFELEEYAAATLEDMVSVAAVDENGDYVGIVINGIARKEEVDYSDKSEECPNPKFKRILKVLGHLDREAKIFEKLPENCHSVLEVRIASTHTGWRGRGLMRVLCEESERIARSIDACAMRMDTTSAFSAAAAERLKYKQVYGTLYADIPYAPQPAPPHVEARVYIKELL
uniref:aralkylamine N-acetyltransferase n=1 Tax=Biston betularia TaxID=82595 RepID=D5LPS6_BISBE|nr:arylalkylamine N-acetyltransferase [Biston betularia]